MINTDFLVVGSGIAGLSLALRASEKGSVAVVTKRSLEESSTKYAQGGIASVLSEEDSFDLHIQDTLEAGAGLCHEDAVRVLVENGPQRIKELMEWGAKFTFRENEGEMSTLDLGREGGHSRRRIVHAADLTGLEVERALIEEVASRHNVHIFEYHMAIDFITRGKLEEDVPLGSPEDTCFGIYALNTEEGTIETFLSPATMLATGGAGKVYLYTSNPDVATGDGVAMAYRAGARIADMEFIQFHPTCLFHPEAKSFLVSEAVRGEGGILKLKDGSTFMENYHHLASLAPRDIVARAIDNEMKKGGDDYVLLDITHLPGYQIRERFPNIYKECLSFGYDMTDEPIPVVPAAHYTCGGVLTDLWGRTNIKGLFACGEAACTGVHGANRLASNSLLEALVYSERAFRAACEERVERSPEILDVPKWDTGKAVNSDELVVVSHNWDEIRRTMWNYVGVFRSDKRLIRAKKRIDILLEEIKEYYWDFIVTGDLLELRNIATVADLIIKSAIYRKESRGLHFNIDYQERNDRSWHKDTVIQITDQGD